jgi:3-isopropylmalate dehydrogenase
VERAVERALEAGALTADLALPGSTAVSTRAMGDAILACLELERSATH